MKGYSMEKKYIWDRRFSMVDTVRNFAIDWQDWASQQDLGYGELVQWTGAIEQLVKATGDEDLLQELKENGIL